MAPKHEDQADRPGHHNRAHPHHHPVGVPRFQVRQQVRSGGGTYRWAVPGTGEKKTMWSFALLVVVLSPALIILGDHQRVIIPDVGVDCCWLVGN